MGNLAFAVAVLGNFFDNVVALGIPASVALALIREPVFLATDRACGVDVATWAPSGDRPLGSSDALVTPARLEFVLAPDQPLLLATVADDLLQFLHFYN